MVSAVCITFVVAIEVLIRQGKITRVITVDYKGVVRATLVIAAVNTIISLVVYFWTNSSEVAITVAVILFAFLFASFLLRVLHEYQNQRMGGSAKRRKGTE